jgi:hypothetical protein
VLTLQAESGRHSPEVSFELNRRLQWAVWLVLSERFNIPESLRFTLCEEIACDLVKAGAYVND